LANVASSFLLENGADYSVSDAIAFLGNETITDSPTAGKLNRYRSEFDYDQKR